jgi:hypothetical protein
MYVCSLMKFKFTFYKCCKRGLTGFVMNHVVKANEGKNPAIE